jgi:hypothetical protein
MILNKIVLNDSLMKNITHTLRSQILIDDLSTYHNEFLRDIADYENVPDLVERKLRYEIYWKLFHSSNTMKLYNSIIDNSIETSRNLYTVEFLGSLTEDILAITIPRHYIRRSFYNQSAAGDHEVTPANANFITLVAKLFGHHKDFVMLEKGDYAILNKSYVKMKVDHEHVLSSQYVEKYILKLGGTTVSTSKRMDFKKGLNDVISEKHTMELFGKEFLKLTKRELKLFEMYLE